MPLLYEETSKMQIQCYLSTVDTKKHYEDLLRALTGKSSVFISIVTVFVTIQRVVSANISFAIVGRQHNASNIVKRIVIKGHNINKISLYSLGKLEPGE